MPVLFVPARRSLLQNKTQNIILGAYTMPDQKSDAVPIPLGHIVPFFKRKFSHAFSHPFMEAFLFCDKEINNVHAQTPWCNVAVYFTTLYPLLFPIT